MNSIYLEKIVQNSKNELNSKFHYSEFGCINARLVCKTLSDNFNLWINVNKRDLDSFYRPVVVELCIEFFKRNYDNTSKIPPNVGDKYQKKGKRYEVTEIGFYIGGAEAVKLECTNKGQNHTVSQALNFFYGDYFKLDDESGGTNRFTFKSMLDFVEKAIGTRHKFSLFPNKFAIVCSKGHFEGAFDLQERKAFPYEYITRNGETQSLLPLDDFMFYVAPDFETIEDFVIDKDIDLDAVIFFGNKEDLQIQQDINRDTVKKVIFIGETNPDIYNLLKWKWTLPEFQYFDDNVDKTVIKPVVVANEKLDEITLRFLNYTESIEHKYGINLRSIYLYISYLYPIVILFEGSRLCNRIESITSRFKKNLEQVLIQEFSVIEMDHTQAHVDLLDIYHDALLQVEFSNNAKSKQIEQLEETEYLLAPPGQTLEVWKQEMKKINWQKVKVISVNKLRELTKQSTVTILALEDNQFFLEIYGGIHNVQWLLYEHEYKNYEKFQTRYDNELIEEFKSKDRKKLSGVDYPDEARVETTESLINRIFDKDFDKDISDKERKYETSYHDYIFKEIIFFDNTSAILSANSSVILINEKNKAVNYRVGDLIVDDKVRIYENQHKDVLLDIIIQSDEHGKYQSILEDSEKWKAVVRDYCTNDIKVKAIALRCGIDPSTVNGWLKPNSSTKFPHSLDKMKDLLGQDYPQIYKSSKNYPSITIAVGRDLSDEISDYIIKGVKGPSLSKLNDDITNSITQHNMPIRKIKSIKIVESEIE